MSENEPLFLVLREPTHSGAPRRLYAARVDSEPSKGYPVNCSESGGYRYERLEADADLIVWQYRYSIDTDWLYSIQADIKALERFGATETHVIDEPLKGAVPSDSEGLGPFDASSCLASSCSAQLDDQLGSTSNIEVRDVRLELVATWLIKGDIHPHAAYLLLNPPWPVVKEVPVYVSVEKSTSNEAGDDSWMRIGR
jgi:hypothetical protein